MGEALMALTEEQQQAIGAYIKLHIHEWIGPRADQPEKSAAEDRERIIRIEETVKVGFKSVEKRFEQMQHSMDKRFEQVDKRFEELLHYTDKRFEDMNRRFSSLQWTMGIGFTLILITTTLFKFIG